MVAVVLPAGKVSSSVSDAAMAVDVPAVDELLNMRHEGADRLKGSPPTDWSEEAEPRLHFGRVAGI